MRILGLLLSILLLSTAVIAAELRIIDYKKGPEYGQQFGDACEGIGDVNNDGFNDFLVTEFRDKKLHLYLGGPAPFSNDPVLSWENHGVIYSSSFSPVNIGDIDCDGVSDFVSVVSGDDTVKMFIGLENLDPNDSKIIFADTTQNWVYYVSGGV